MMHGSPVSAAGLKPTSALGRLGQTRLHRCELSGGFGVLLYAHAWVVMPLEPTPDASDEAQETGLRGLTLGVLMAGAGTAACFFWEAARRLASTESSLWRQPS
jgi:hypothetical protein